MSFLQISEAEWSVILLSVKVAVISTIISVPFAITFGWFMGRYRFRGKSVFEGIIHLPLVMPPVATGYLLLIVLGKQGFIGKLIFNWFGVQIAFTQTAAVIAAIVVSFPLITRSVRTSFEMVDIKLEAASRSLGISPLKTFFRISFPLAFSGILSGTILGFARCLGEFGATITFAGNISGKTSTIPMAVYSNMQIPGKESATIRLVIVSVIISLIAMIIAEYLNRKVIRKRS
ncbi:MAG: molybdate ABC transporter permease subunit [Bacteroidales bacterium]|nr:molybdate ABC transporter permease subunit [Bacteroidales bacterium]